MRNQFNKMKPTDSIVVLKGDGSIFLKGGDTKRGSLDPSLNCALLTANPRESYLVWVCSIAKFCWCLKS